MVHKWRSEDNLPGSVLPSTMLALGTELGLSGVVAGALSLSHLLAQ